MEKLPYKILTISWDPTLAMDNPSFGDAQERNIAYGRGVENIFSVTYSRRSQNLKNKKLSENVFVYPTSSANPIVFIFDAWQLAKKIAGENKIDLVLTQDPFLTGLVGSWVKKKFGCKLLIHYHGDFWRNPKWLRENWYNYFFNFLQRIVLKKADALRVMSIGQKEKFIKTGWSEKRIRVISTPVDLSKYLNNELRIKNNGSSKVVLHVGRDDEVKDYDTLIRAFKIIKEKFPNIRFIQAGADKEIKEAMAKNKFSNVELKGLRPQEELTGLYQQCDVFILSSTSESFGKVLVEANACAKPVVSTATTGAQDIIEDGKNGFLTPIGDAEKLAEKIIWLLEHPEEAEKMGERGRQLMQDKYGDNTEKIVGFWDDIINNKL